MAGGMSVNNFDFDLKMKALRTRVDALRAPREPQVMVQVHNKTVRRPFIAPVRPLRFRITNQSVPVWARDAALLLMLALFIFDIARGQSILFRNHVIVSVIDPAQPQENRDRVSFEPEDFRWVRYTPTLFVWPTRTTIVSTQDIVPNINQALNVMNIDPTAPRDFDVNSSSYQKDLMLPVPLQIDAGVRSRPPDALELNSPDHLPNLATQSPQFIGMDHELVAIVSKSRQNIQIFRQGVEMYSWQVSTARQGKITPTGTWTAQWLSKDHKSSLYNNAPMPYSIFFSGHYAIHGTDAVDRLGTPASAGCVRLHPDHAKTLFTLVQDVGKSNFAIRIIN